MSTSYADGVNFSWPTKDDTNWDGIVNEALSTISGHDHTGGGQGAAIGSGALAANIIVASKIRLENNTALRALNAAGNADVNLFKLTTGDLFSLLTALILSSTNTDTGTGAVGLTTTITVLNRASGTGTLAAGAEGQIKFLVNINSGGCVITPSVTAGTNTATLAQHGAVLYVYMSGEWRACAFAGCTLA